MLQTSFSNVSSVFSDVCCSCVYLDVAYASHICCKYFIWMLRMRLQWLSSVFLVCFTSVSDACFKCFICLHTYVTSVPYKCFKSRSDVARVAIWPICHSPSCYWSAARESPCGRLGPADASTMHIHKRGEAGALQSVMALRGYGCASITGMGQGALLLGWDGMGRGALDALEREQHPECLLRVRTS
jgi:hypothetical protein